MHQDATCHGALASACRWLAQATYEVARILIRLGDEMTAAARTLRHRQHLVVDKTHQAPGPRDGEQGLHVAGGDLLGLEFIGLHHRVDVFHRADLAQVLVDVEKQ